MRKRIPEFPTDIQSCSLSYQDLLKIQKRAESIGITSSEGGERYVWILKILNHLEKWASHVIPVNQSNEIRNTLEYLHAAEKQFGTKFMMTVPLFKAIRGSNRKLFRMIEIYDNQEDTEWIDESVVSTSPLQLDKILTPQDLERVHAFHAKINHLISLNYFNDLDFTVSFLNSLHPDDVQGHQAFGLLQQGLTLSGRPPYSPETPCHCRVKPAFVSMLIAIIALTPFMTPSSSASITPSYLKQVRKCIEKTNDSNFKKISDFFLTNLSIVLFPKTVEQFLSLWINQYGHMRRLRRQSSFEEMTHHGIQTRQKSAMKSETRSHGLFLSSRKISKFLSQSARLISQNEAALSEHIEKVELLRNNLLEEEIEMNELLVRLDLTKWIFPWSETRPSTVYFPIIRSSLSSGVNELIEKISNFKFNRNIIFYRNFLGSAIDMIGVYRGLIDLLDAAISRSPVSVDHLKSITERCANVNFPLLTAAQKTVDQINAAMLRLGKAKSVGELESTMETLNTIIRSEQDWIIVDLSGNEKFDFSSQIVSEMHALRADVLDYTKGVPIDSIRVRPDLVDRISRLMSHGYDATDPLEWHKIPLLIDWYSRAKFAIQSNDINRLVGIHDEYMRAGFGSIAVTLGGSENFNATVAHVESRVSRIESLIADLTKNHNMNALVQLDTEGVVFYEIEKIRMLQSDYEASLGRLRRWADDDVIFDKKISIGSIRRSLECIGEFHRREEGETLVTEFSEIVSKNDQLIESRDRVQVESILKQFRNRYVSIEISIATESLEKTLTLESEIASILKKSDGIKAVGKETPNQALNRLLDLANTKYEILKKSKKLKFLIIPEIRQKLLISFFNTLAGIVQVWATHRRTITGGSGLAPRWLLLFSLRAIGGCLLTTSSSSMQWISNQLNACNEILKESKKSFSDFSRNRFLIPQFHFALYEPMEKIRQNFESKMVPVVIKYAYKDTSRIVDYICTFNTETKKVVERMFPKPGSPGVVEPENSEKITEEFNSREIPKTVEEAQGKIVELWRLIRSDLKSAKTAAPAVGTAGMSSATQSSESKSTPQGSNMSFTKFLSSSFSNLDIPSAESVESRSNSNTDELSDMWINNVDQLVSGVGESFFSKYFDLIEKSKQAREVKDDVGFPVAPPVTIPNLPRPISGPPPSRPPGFSAPPQGSPKSSGGTTTPQIGLTDEPLVMWSGTICGGAKQEYEFQLNLIPFFQTPVRGSPDYLNLKRVLSDHNSMTLEGSLSISKFNDYYAKLMAPVNRRKREPFNFIIPIPGARMGEFFSLLPMNTANAFAIQIPPYKIKLWILSVDGTMEYKPLPVLPGVVFGFLEVPPNVFSLSNGVLNNLFNPIEMSQLASAIGMEIERIGKSDEIGSVFIQAPSLVLPVIEQLPVQVPPVASTPASHYLIPPSQPTALAVPKPTPDDSLSRVFEIINRAPHRNTDNQLNEEADRIMENLASSIPAQPPHVRATYRPSAPPSAPSYLTASRPAQPPMGPPGWPSSLPIGSSSAGWSSSSVPPTKFVIGAPSTGPSIDQLPAPRKGICRFFNSAQGCQQGRNCKFSHNCSVCGSESHSGPEHYQLAAGVIQPGSGMGGYPGAPGYPAPQQQYRSGY